MNSKKINDENIKNTHNNKYVQSYINYLQYNRNYSQLTYSHYQSVIIEFLDYIGDKKIENLELNDFQSYISVKKKNYKKTTKNNYISILRKFFKFCDDNFDISLNFIGEIRNIKDNYEIQIPLSIKEFNMLLSCSCENEFEDFLIKVMYFGALRVSEAINVLTKDVDIYNRKILIHGKGNKQRYVMYPKALDNQMKKIVKSQEFLIEINNLPVSRQKIYSIFTNIVKKYGLPFSLHPHKLRRTLATHFLIRGFDIRELQMYLGHDSIASTEKYLKYSKEELKEKVNMAFMN